MKGPTTFFCCVFLVCFIGGVLSCLEDASCKEYDDRAKREDPNSNKLSYCTYLRQRNECYMLDIYDCTQQGPDFVPNKLTEMLNEYNSQCNATEEKMVACKASFETCISLSKLLSNPFTASNYCNELSTAIQCIKGNVLSCDASVRAGAATFYDKLQQKLCGGSGTKGLVECMNIYQSCFKAIKVNAPVTPEATCIANGKLLTCLRQNYTGCPSSVGTINVAKTISDYSSKVGSCHMMKDYACPKTLTCIANIIKRESTTGPPRVNFQATCLALSTAFSCIGNELSACGVPVKSSLSFAKLSGMFKKGCDALAKGPKLLACNEFQKCVINLIPSTAFQGITKEFLDTRFGCGILRSTVMCGLYYQKPCSDTGADLNTALADVKKEADEYCANSKAPAPLCPAAWTCLTEFSKAPISQSCPFGKAMFSCLETKLKACQIPSVESISFSAVSSFFTKACAGIESAPAIVKCSQFSSCVTASKIPRERTTKYTSPGYWCSLVKYVAACGTWNAKPCGLTSNPFTSTFMDMQKKCPSGELPAPNCPAVLKCTEHISGVSSQSGGLTKNIFNVCPKMQVAMECMGNSLKSCGIPVATSYSFSRVGELFEESCAVFAKSTELTSCTQLGTCIEEVKLPTKQEDVLRKYSNPSFWCSLLRDVVTCGFNSVTQCKQASNNDLINGLASLSKTINSVCPENDKPKQITDGGNANHCTLTNVYVVTMAVICVSVLFPLQ